MFLAKLKGNIKQVKDKINNPLTDLLDKYHITPNLLTILSLLCGLISAYFLFISYEIFVILIICHFLFDGLDGSLARKQYKKQRTRGMMYDFFVDRAVVFAILLRVSLYQQDETYLALIFLIILYLFFTLIYLIRDARFIKNIFFIDPFIIFSVILNTYWVIFPLVIFSYLANFLVILLSRKKQ